MLRAGLVLEPTDPKRAQALYVATFILGQQLFKERLTHAELATGLMLLAEAAPQIQRVDPQRSAELEEFKSQRIELSQKRIVPIWTAIGSIDDVTIRRHAGDVFVFAKESRERVWRVEAVFALGRSQFNPATPGDRINAIRVLKRLAEQEPDPIVKLAAQAARDLTIEDYRMLR